MAAISSSLLGRHREKRKAKYTAITTLSAASAAATSSGDVCRISETATKLTAPPICHTCKLTEGQPIEGSSKSANSQSKSGVKSAE